MAAIGDGYFVKVRIEKLSQIKGDKCALNRTNHRVRIPIFGAMLNMSLSDT